MLNSMTAYGRAEKKSDFGNVIVEMQSVNRKFLDLTISLPKEFSSLDVPVRHRISSLIKRGKVNVKVFVEFCGETPVTVRPNLPLVRQIKEAWELMEKDLHVVCGIDLKTLLQMPDVFQFSTEGKSEEKWNLLIHEALDEALANAAEMKQKEGFAIQQDFESRLKTLRNALEEIQVFCPEVKARNKEKLKQTLSEVMDEGKEFEERLLREACLFAEKVDIEEEITRLTSHLKQFDERMKSSSEPVGKILEFLLQEMLREVNTIGSKAQDLRISNLVVQMKTEVERIREQLQNVE